MNFIIRTMVAGILVGCCCDCTLAQNETRKPNTQPPRSVQDANSLDDIRASVAKKLAESKKSGGMSMGSSGMGMGYPGSGAMSMPGAGYGGPSGGMSGGGGMPGGGDYGSMGGMGADMGMGMGMEGPPPSEKQLLLSMIDNLRGKLNSKKNQREDIEKLLRAALSEYFIADMQSRVQEFDKVKARVVEMESKLQRRLDRKQDVIELQLKQMLHKADGLEFFVPTSGELGMMGGEAGGYGAGYGAADLGGGYSGRDMGSGLAGGAGLETGPSAVEELLGYDFGFGATRFARNGVLPPQANDPLVAYDKLDGSSPDEKQQMSQAEKANDNDKMKAILLGLHQFEYHFHHLPASLNRQTKDQPPHSWRVAILPMLGYGGLYKQYKFDEAWDSDNNKRLIDKMPSVFSSAKGSKNRPTYFMLVDGGAAFASDRPTKFADITDGMSNTIALIKAERDIPWTKPEDIVYSPTLPLPSLSDDRLVGFADGRVVQLPERDEQTMRALITRAGGEPL
ncbi:MAG: DUF1559 domain-containing protein [Pirellula sp.]